MNWRSHTKDELCEAIKNGERLWELETGNSGEDDILIGNSYEEVLNAVLSYYGIDRLPHGWSIEEIDWDVGDELGCNAIRPYEDIRIEEVGYEEDENGDVYVIYEAIDDRNGKVLGRMGITTDMANTGYLTYCRKHGWNYGHNAYMLCPSCYYEENPNSWKRIWNSDMVLTIGKKSERGR